VAVTLDLDSFKTAGSSKEQRHWLAIEQLTQLPTLRPETRLREIATDDVTNTRGYTFNVYWATDLNNKEPTGVVWHEGKFHHFFHSERSGRPYLGGIHKKATQFEVNQEPSTDREEVDKLTRKIRHTSISLKPA
jgi:hypothetical protein